ncbi:universal stress protein [Microvirga antarctica]|uniref:universal stress protein n=1 Tax=Microvirga antarctica TaxID=2819233 RepID=UPI001B30FAF0|nr:universal stress protein [Microvirga antarctica]
MYRNILVATDGSSLSGRAVEHGAGLAEELGAKLFVLTVTERFHVFAVEADQLEETPTSFKRQMKMAADRALSEATAIASRVGMDPTPIHVEDDAPYAAIIRTAEERRCDVIVMASHGRGGLSAFLLGSETMKVLAHSKIPVLVVR